MQANTKEPHSVTVYIQVNHGSLQWGQESTLGMFLTGQGWEGEVTFLRKAPENAHRDKMVDKRCVFLHLGQGGGCLLGALNKGVPRLSIDMAHTHTHTHRRTHDNMLVIHCK